MFEERRQHPRVVPNSPTFVSLDHSRSGLLLNAGEGGIAVASLMARNLDELISVAFELPDGRGSIQAEAEIAWTKDEGHLTGARFVNVDELSLRQLCDWISASPKEQLSSHESGMASEPEQLALPVQEERAAPVIEEADVAAESTSDVFEGPEMRAMDASLLAGMSEPQGRQERIEPSAESEPRAGSAPHEGVATNQVETDAEGAPVQDFSAQSVLSQYHLDPFGSIQSAAISEQPMFETSSTYAQIDPMAHAIGHEPATPEITSPVWAPMEQARPEKPQVLRELGLNSGPSKGRHTIELILAVVVLSWALVYLGYQMGSTGVNRQSIGSSSAIAAASEMPAVTAKRSESPSQGPMPSAQASPAPPREAPPSVSALGDAGVVLQVGAMKVEENADLLAQQLQKRNMPAFVFRHGPDGLYHVAVGPFGDGDTTARMRAKLEKQGLKPIMRRWLPE